MDSGLKDCIDKILKMLKLEGPNFEETPERIERLVKTFIERPYPKMKTFPSISKEMVVLKDFTTWGFCPHHLLPVQYTFKMGYIPDKVVLGLSKLGRIAEFFLSGLPLQEDLPKLIVDELCRVLAPKGCGCLIEGRHLCMEIRGVKATGTFVTTSLRGIFLTDASTKEEFLNA